MYAGTDIDLAVAWNLAALRLTVRDNSPNMPYQQNSGLGTQGRGLTIAAGLSRAFGVLPTADGGKVVWAVLTLPDPSTRAAPADAGAATQQEPSLAAIAGAPLRAGPRPHRAATPAAGNGGSWTTANHDGQCAPAHNPLTP
jgi:hypothetical protein